MKKHFRRRSTLCTATLHRHTTHHPDSAPYVSRIKAGKSRPWPFLPEVAGEPEADRCQPRPPKTAISQGGWRVDVATAQLLRPVGRWLRAPFSASGRRRPLVETLSVYAVPALCFLFPVFVFSHDGSIFFCSFPAGGFLSCRETLLW